MDKIQFKLIIRILVVIAKAILLNANVTDSAGSLCSEVHSIEEHLDD